VFGGVVETPIGPAVDGSTIGTDRDRRFVASVPRASAGVRSPAAGGDRATVATPHAMWARLEPAGVPDPATMYDLLADGDDLEIVCHNNPDPDCLASAFALGRVAADAGVDDVRISYAGSITHQQNRAFVNLLEVELSAFEAEAVVDRHDGSLLAFVDHSTPGENNRVPEGTPVDVVIDHHPAEGVEARYVDRREEAGATATILTEYVDALEVGFDGPLATALLFAIRRETLTFLRGVTAEEYAAAARLHEAVDRDLLRRLSTPSVSGATVDAIADAIRNRRVHRSALVTHVGRTDVRDALPQAADYLATLEGVQTAVAFGIVGDAIHLSARSSDPRVHVGDAMEAAFDDVGSAGGHRVMAGGEVPLGIVADYAGGNGDDLVRIVERVVTDRLADVLHLAESREE
jgi:nanoRNase/pAp phosphatase (c-di-AMP/oligoRNAs hydrolase)